MANNKQTAIVRKAYHWIPYNFVSPKGDNIITDKDINFSKLNFLIEDPSARTFYSQHQRTMSILVKGAADLDFD